jgi:enamine deaminase RidA (YjgF/YER057c/UK114 family)
VGQGEMREQCEQVYKSLTHALRAAGAAWGDVIKVNGYMVGLNPAAVNIYREVRSRYFDKSRMPASTLVGVDRLVHEDLLLEVEVIAAVSDRKPAQAPKKAKKKS